MPTMRHVEGVFWSATAVLGGARDVDANDESRGGRLLYFVLPPQLLLFGVGRLRA